MKPQSQINKKKYISFARVELGTVKHKNLSPSAYKRMRASINKHTHVKIMKKLFRNAVSKFPKLSTHNAAKCKKGKQQ